MLSVYGLLMQFHLFHIPSSKGFRDSNEGSFNCSSANNNNIINSNCDLHTLCSFTTNSENHHDPYRNDQMKEVLSIVRSHYQFFYVLNLARSLTPLTSTD